MWKAKLPTNRTKLLWGGRWKLSTPISLEEPFLSFFISPFSLFPFYTLTKGKGQEKETNESTKIRSVRENGAENKSWVWNSESAFIRSPYRIKHTVRYRPPPFTLSLFLSLKRRNWQGAQNPRHSLYPGQENQNDPFHPSKHLSSEPSWLQQSRPTHQHGIRTHQSWRMWSKTPTPMLKDQTLNQIPNLTNPSSHILDSTPTITNIGHVW